MQDILKWNKRKWTALLKCSLNISGNLRPYLTNSRLQMQTLFNKVTFMDAHHNCCSISIRIGKQQQKNKKIVNANDLFSKDLNYIPVSPLSLIFLKGPHLERWMGHWGLPWAASLLSAHLPRWVRMKAEQSGYLGGTPWLIQRHYTCRKVPGPQVEVAHIL